MAKSLNRVMLIGNMTRDIEIRYTPANKAVGNFGLAMNRSWRTPDGQVREEVTFVDCEIWDKGAEILKQYTSKGAPLYAEGRLKLDEWQDKQTGQKRTKLKIVIEDFRLLGGRPGGGGGGAGGGAADGEYHGGSGGHSGGSGGGSGGGDDGYDQSPRPVTPQRRAGAQAANVDPDDIPF